jgi:hypothetical protein
VPADPADLSVPRWSVRSKGEQAFLFYNGHVRQYALPAQKQVQFAVKLDGQAVTLPRQPVDIAAGSYFFWPINFDMDGYRLHYATVQPVARAACTCSRRRTALRLNSRWTRRLVPASRRRARWTMQAAACWCKAFTPASMLR